MKTIAEKLVWLTAHPVWTPCRRLWARFPPFVQHLLQSLLIGTVAALVLHVARPYVPGLAGAETAATDWAIKFWQDRLDTSGGSDERFVFLSIDERTYRAWGDPLFVPRDKLLRLIQFAAEAPAKLVIVDVELTKHVPLQPPSGSPASLPVVGPDDALAGYLRRYSEQAGSSGTTGAVPHILFARTIAPRPVEQSEAGQADPLREERPSEFLEDIVARSLVLHWASPLSDRDADGLVRNWRLLEPTCLGTAPHAVPSIALLSWGIVRNPLLSQGRFMPNDFQSELVRRFAPEQSRCAPDSARSSSAGVVPAASWTLYDAVLAKPLTLGTKPSDLEQRVFYKFHPSTSLAGQFAQVSALLITDQRPEQPLSRELAAGKIVIIGSGYEAGKDVYFTPIGDMPGAVVIANQINALLEFGQFREVSRGLRWIGLLLLIVIFSLSFSLFTKTWGANISTLVVNVVLGPLSLWLFQYGWWLDLVFPLFVLQAYQRFVDIEVSPPPVIRRHRHANEGT